MTMKTRSFDSPWRFWHGAAVLAAAMTAYMALSWAHMEIVRSTVGMEAYLGDGPRLPPDVLLIGQLNKAVALMTMLALVGLWPKRLSWHAVGFRPVRAGWVGLAALIAVVAFAIRLGLAKAIVMAAPEWIAFARAPFAFDAQNGWLISAGFLAATILVTPMAEEVFFRGFLFKWMAGHKPVWLAALVSSILFGVMHILPPQAISAALMALVLCWLYWRTGSIWPAIVAHMTNNAIGILLGAAAAAGQLPDWLTP